MSHLDNLKLRLSSIKDKNSKEYKVLKESIIRTLATEEWDIQLSAGGYVVQDDLTNFSKTYSEYGSENYIRGIIVPMILENYGHKAIK